MNETLSNLGQWAKSNKTGIALASTGALLGIGAYAVAQSRKKRAKRKTKNRKSVHRNSKRNRKQKRPYTARKRKDTSTRRIRYTKNNQPYVIMANGRARFIKKSSVKNSRKRAGGRY